LRAPKKVLSTLPSGLVACSALPITYGIFCPATSSVEWELTFSFFAAEAPLSDGLVLGVNSPLDARIFGEEFTRHMRKASLWRN
jgi:hypothetical protein